MSGHWCRRRGGRALWLALLAWLLPTAAPGGSERPLPPPTDPAWEDLALPGVRRPTEYRAADGDGVLEARARCGGSGLAVATPAIDLAATPVLRWRWRADQLPEGLDERTREGDDFAVRVSALFAFEPERAGVVERVRHDLLGRVAGREMPASALHFVWTVEVPPGTVWDNPRTDRAKNWALERGPATGWREASIDVAVAYRSAFGREPPPLLGVGLMTDADDHCGRARGRYADFRFTASDADREGVAGIEP